ncbi:hypothetical protein TSOC_005838 [Tetrabaena socialis]|uniref:Uncharacterized protein n=1 Tax=Tetrabaena socialis TaxID=47790 RepID=A0A2J8A545_9CHLO|nr:hypothetical protein TSOC_005838 [Tetrabaena socialis]|eukprot:PNH07662.1 hypothetical protein TSOC_005838 [Tetrabaena socialis]
MGAVGSCLGSTGSSGTKGPTKQAPQGVADARASQASVAYGAPGSLNLSPGDLPILDRAALGAALGGLKQPVAVLYVAYVSPTDDDPNAAAAAYQCSMDSINGQISTSPDAGVAVVVRRSSLDGAQHLVFSSDGISVAVGCVLANPAAVRALQLRNEQDFLHFLARSFKKDPSFKLLFNDVVKRLLQGQQHAFHHFCPGDFGRERFFLSMRISPCAYRCAPQEVPGGCGGCDGGCDGSCGAGVTPAMVLELDVPYEGKELAARLQRDYMVLSGIPSIVSMFDFSG